jgi:hypothetical protein
VRQTAAAAARTAREVSDAPGLLFRLQDLQVSGSTLGVVNRAKSPPFRLFTSDTAIAVTGLSNHKTDNVGDIRVQGRFMGSGPLAARARFRPDPERPMLDLRLQIEDADLRALNDLLAAYGKLDVAAGRFSFYSEIRVEDRRVRGYVKPLVHDVQVYDERQDREKSAFRKLWERVMTGVASLLENRPRDEVATRVELSGRLDDPNVGTLQAVVRLLENAFVRAILPGFERRISRERRA